MLRGGGGERATTRARMREGCPSMTELVLTASARARVRSTEPSPHPADSPAADRRRRARSSVRRRSLGAALRSLALCRRRASSSSRVARRRRHRASSSSSCRQVPPPAPPAEHRAAAVHGVRAVGAAGHGGVHLLARHRAWRAAHGLQRRADAARRFSRSPARTGRLRRVVAVCSERERRWSCVFDGKLNDVSHNTSYRFEHCQASHS